MVTLIRPVDVEAYGAIADAFSRLDCAGVASLCARADSILDGAKLRLWHASGVVSESEKTWRLSVRTMFRSFVKDSPRRQRGTLEEWGAELALHVAIVLAMPSFQSRYLLSGCGRRTDDVQCTPTDIDALEALAKKELAGPSGSEVVNIEWPSPVGLIVLGEMDGGLMASLLENDAAFEFLSVREEPTDTLNLFGKEKIVKGDALAEVQRLVEPIGEAAVGVAKEVARELVGVLRSAANGPGGVLISCK